MRRPHCLQYPPGPNAVRGRQLETCGAQGVKQAIERQGDMVGTVFDGASAFLKDPAHGIQIFFGFYKNRKVVAQALLLVGGFQIGDVLHPQNAQPGE